MVAKQPDRRRSAPAETEPARDRAKTEARQAAVAAYNAVVATAELLTVRLIDLKFVAKADYATLRDEEAEQGQRLSRREIDFSLAGESFVPDKSLLAGTVRGTITIRRGRKTLVNIAATYLVAYSDVAAVEPEHALAYLRRVGRFAVYPYFRSLVAVLSETGELALPTLPVLK